MCPKITVSLLRHNSTWRIQSRVAAPKEMRLHGGCGRHWCCRRDMLRQPFPNTSNGDQKGLIADSWQPRRADNQRRRRGGTWTNSSLKVCRLAGSSARNGAAPWWHLYERKASLKSIRSPAFNQCSWQMSGVMWSYRDNENTRGAAELHCNALQCITDWLVVSTRNSCHVRRECTVRYNFLGVCNSAAPLVILYTQQCMQLQLGVKS